MKLKSKLKNEVEFTGPSAWSGTLDGIQKVGITKVTCNGTSCTVVPTLKERKPVHTRSPSVYDMSWCTLSQRISSLFLSDQFGNVYLHELKQTEQCY